MGASNSHESDVATTPRRVLKIDPRSPSGDISRTPIVVQNTPDNILDMDPRSPTVGIARTPLAFPQQTKQESEKGPFDVPQLDLEADTEGDHIPDETDAQKEELLGVTGIENITLDDFPTSESTRLVPYEDQPEAAKDKSKVKKQKPRSTQPKELFPSKKKSHQFENVTRSPLSSRNVNMDSPLQIVQRKQLKEIDLKRNCGLESSNSRSYIVQDKENM